MEQQPKKKKQASNNLQLKELKGLTANQQLAIDYWQGGICECLLLHGSAGTGKTYLALSLALAAIEDNMYQKVVVIRSSVPTRDIGFLPGKPAEKVSVYEAPYHNICAELYGRGDAYGILKTKGMIEFATTSFIRGITILDCVIIVDEIQNMDFNEINSVITRVGENCAIILCGDIKQDDLTSERYREQSGIKNFMKILNSMNAVDSVEFTTDDIVRSGFIKEYLIERERLGI